MLDTVTALPASGEVIRPEDYDTTYDYAFALRALSDKLLDRANRPMPASRWLDVPAGRAA